MVNVAKEMQRQGFSVPLLIGGATTSRVHTAVKIAPHYDGPVVYVPDASRSVGVCSELLSDDKATAFINELKSDYERVRVQHANKKATPMVTLAQARANKTPIDWAGYEPPKPKFTEPLKVPRKTALPPESTATRVALSVEPAAP